ncbi:MAG: mandelate racemase/muconate lactonizing enzyme family protein, partial [Cryobacterium sp.]|nr:mandelate racemase/muconate lactonizing enzyme family protein [Cryobacterium sp.]
MGTELSVRGVRAVLLSAVYAPGEELVWVGGAIRSWDAALVEVTLADGSVGVGEAGAGIMAAGAVPGIVQAFRPYLLDRAFAHPLEVGDVLRAYTAFWSRGGILSGVCGAIETAVLDAVAKREGVPAYELMGGLKRERIEAYASGGLGTTFDQIDEWASRQAEVGFRTVKFRAMTDPDTTIALLDHVVPRLPPGVRFILDAVQGCASHPWLVEDAIRVGREVERHGARWYEEPCFATDVEGYARVKAELGVVVSGVESHGTLAEFSELIRSEGVGLAQPDVSFVGGPASFHRVADLAAVNGVACVPHVWGSGVTLAANLHASLSHDHVR